MYITPWFMRMFSHFDDWNLALFAFDFVIEHGEWSSSLLPFFSSISWFCIFLGIVGMFRLSLSIMDLIKGRLLQAPDLSKILPCLLYLPKDVVTQAALEATLPAIQISREKVDQIELDLKLKHRDAKRPRPAALTDSIQREKRTKITEEEAQPVGLYDRLMTPVRKHFGLPRVPTITQLPEEPFPPKTEPQSTSKLALSPTSVAAFVEFSTPTPIRQKRRAPVEEPESASKSKKKTDTMATTVPAVAAAGMVRRTLEDSPGTEMEEKEPSRSALHLRSRVLAFEFDEGEE